MLNSCMESRVTNRILALNSFVFILLATAAASGQVTIGDLKNADDNAMGCTCTVQKKAAAAIPHSRKFLFLSEPGTEDAWMNINGRDTKLKLVKTSAKEDDLYEVGSRFYEEYEAPGVKVRIDYVTTWVCPPDDEQCDHIKHDATITVTKGKSKTTLKAIAVCAC